MIEIMLDGFDRAYGMKYVALRYFNASGGAPDRGEDHKPETHLIPLILQVALGQRSTISVFGVNYPTPDGTCIRDYVHVADLADAHLAALDHLRGGGESEIFNLGNGQGYSVREVIDAARKLTGHPIPEILAARRPGDPSVLVAGSEKARTILNWVPKHPSLEEIVGSAWDWHKSHPQGYGH